MTENEMISSDFPRDRMSLNGTWEFVHDPNTVGDESEWYDVDISWPDRAQKVTVPHSWQEHDDLTDYTGMAWYRRTFEVPEWNDDDLDAILRFGAVDYEANIWVNGTHIGSHHGGYLPFEFEVTSALGPGENQIVVSVFDPEDLSEIPHGKQGDPWYTRVSGIWQSVTLDFRPKTRVTDVKITPDLASDTAVIDVDVTSENTKNEDIKCHVVARLDGERITSEVGSLSPDDEFLLSFDDPTYWSPQNPVLYNLHILLFRDEQLLDHYTEEFGFRSFELEQGEFRLNGEPFRMRGVLEQGYYPKTQYRPSNNEMFAKEVQVAKELGFNLIRKHVKPAHPTFLAEADQQGILVWEEPANPTVFSERSKSELQDQLYGLIDRDYNRPSVVIWSLYNEEWGIGHEDSEETLWTDKEKQAFLSELYKKTKERDETRVVCDNSGWAHVESDINDFHRYFVSPDRAQQWENDLDHIGVYPQDNFAHSEHSHNELPIVISELGTWGLGEISTLLEGYNSDPNWFSHDFLTNPVKCPAEFRSRFTETDLDDVFEDLDQLARSWQRREYISIKHLLEEVRIRSSIDGYILTELSDVEWEFNGILDYHRNEKVFHEKFSSVNGQIAVIARPKSHVGWGGSTLPTTIYVVNDSTEDISGLVKWSFGEWNGSEVVSVPSQDETAVTTITFELPAVEHGVNKDQLEVKFEGNCRTVETTEPIFTGTRSNSNRSVATVYAEGSFASRLSSEGVDVTPVLSDMVDIAFSDSIDENLKRFADQGGTVVQIPTIDGNMNSSPIFTFSEIPPRESWLGTTSLFYQNSKLLDNICPSARLGWEFEGLYPLSVVTELDQAVDHIHVGYVEGWLANWASPFVVRGYGSGSMAALTFRIRDAYGNHPVATLFCNRIIGQLSN